MTRAVRSGLLKFALLTGAADSDTAGIACAAQDGVAITTDDILIGVVNLAVTDNTWSDDTANSAIIAGNKITCTASGSDVIAVWWLARDAGLQVASPFIGSEVGAGTSADTDITITGIAATDILISVVEVDATTGAWTNRTGASSITAADTIQCTASTAGNSVFAIYMDLSGNRAFSSLNLQFRIGTISTPNATVTDINTEDVVLVAIAADEVDFDILDDLTSVASVSAANTLLLNEPSPTATEGSKMLVFYQKSNDLAT